MMTRAIVCLSILFFSTAGQLIFAQSENNPLLYSFQAVQFSDQQVSHDPVSLVMPGTAYLSGFGSYLDNPASSALYNSSYGSLGLVFRNVSEEGRFLGNTMEANDRQSSISNVGLVYKFPTTQGSFVIGAGYSQHSFYNRAMELGGRNNNTTITDQFKIPGSTYQELAFNTYATDYGDEFEDWDESIFRIGFNEFGDYLGIDQEAKIIQGGFGGEYSAFMATEFLENLMVGVSLGFQSGRYTYERLFLEIDSFGDYDSSIIDSDDNEEGDTDIDRILLTDDIQYDYYSFKARIGVLYRLANMVNMGASYTFPGRLTVNEKYDTRIATTFDNSEVFEDELNSDYTFYVESPSKLNLGLAFTDIGRLSISIAGEYINFENTALDFDDDNFEAERDENRFISDTYTDVWNVRGGIAYDVSNELTLRGGFGYQPSRFKHIDIDKKIYSAGAGFSIGPDARIEIGAQYVTWEEQSVVYSPGIYDYSSLPGAPPTVTEQPAEFANLDLSRIQILATLQMRLY